MHTHHTHPNKAEPRKRNIPKVSIRHGDAGISPHSQKESCHQAKKSDERLPNGVMDEGVTECWSNGVMECEILVQPGGVLVSYFFSIAACARRASSSGATSSM